MTILGLWWFGAVPLAPFQSPLRRITGLRSVSEVTTCCMLVNQRTSKAESDPDYSISHLHEETTGTESLWGHKTKTKSSTSRNEMSHAIAQLELNVDREKKQEQSRQYQQMISGFVAGVFAKLRNATISFVRYFSLFHRAFWFIKYNPHQLMHFFIRLCISLLSYIKIT